MSYKDDQPNENRDKISVDDKENASSFNDDYDNKIGDGRILNELCIKNFRYYKKNKKTTKKFTSEPKKFQIRTKKIQDKKPKINPD